VTRHARKLAGTEGRTDRGNWGRKTDKRMVRNWASSGGGNNNSSSSSSSSSTGSGFSSSIATVLPLHAALMAKLGAMCCRRCKFRQTVPTSLRSLRIDRTLAFFIAWIQAYTPSIKLPVKLSLKKDRYFI
jgi:hypothetical protein